MGNAGFPLSLTETASVPSLCAITQQTLLRKRPRQLYQAVFWSVFTRWVSMHRTLISLCSVSSRSWELRTSRDALCVMSCQKQREPRAGSSGLIPPVCWRLWLQASLRFEGPSFVLFLIPLKASKYWNKHFLLMPINLHNQIHFYGLSAF